MSKQDSTIKITVLILIVLSMLSSVYAAVPTFIGFQGKLTNDTTGSAINPASVWINITNLSNYDEVIWNNIFNNTVDSYGVFDFVLGKTYQLNLTPGMDYSLVMAVDYYGTTFGEVEVVYGDNSPAGDVITVNAGGPSDATELVMSDNVTTVESRVVYNETLYSMFANISNLISNGTLYSMFANVSQISGDANSNESLAAMFLNISYGTNGTFANQTYVDKQFMNITGGTFTGLVNITPTYVAGKDLVALHLNNINTGGDGNDANSVSLIMTAENAGGGEMNSRIQSNITEGPGETTLSFHTKKDSVVTPKMVIDGSGNVGIGTTAPTSKLTVVGAINSTTRISAEDRISLGNVSIGSWTDINQTGSVEENATLWSMFMNISGGKFTGDLDGVLNINGNITTDGGYGGPGLKITNDGNIYTDGKIGIGTELPVNELEVHGKIKSTQEINGSGLNISGAGYFGGKVGIGTTAPNAKLEIIDSQAASGDALPGFNVTAGQGADDVGSGGLGGNLFVEGGKAANVVVPGSGGGISILAGDTGGGGGIGGNVTITAGDSSTPGVGGSIIIVSGTSTAGTAGDIFLTTGTGATNGDVIMVKDGGNVGIGTTGPGVELEINGTDAMIRLSDTGSGNDSNPYMEFYNSSSRKAYLGYASSGNNHFYLSINEGDFVIPNGDVGIGTTAPSKKLEVDGTMNATTVCGNRFMATPSVNAATDTGNEMATEFTNLETEGKTYTCLMCFEADASPSDCSSVSAGQFCEFKIVC